MIDAALGGLEAYFRAERDSDKRAAAVDAFNARFATPCLTTAQTTRLLALAGTLAGQARREEASFPSNPLAAVGAFLGLLVRPETWIRAGEVIGGGVLLYMGVRSLLSALGAPVSLPSPAAAVKAVTPA